MSSNSSGSANIPSLLSLPVQTPSLHYSTATTYATDAKSLATAISITSPPPPPPPATPAFPFQSPQMLTSLPPPFLPFTGVPTMQQIIPSKPLSLTTIPPPRDLDLTAIPEPQMNVETIKIPDALCQSHTHLPSIEG